MRIISVDLLIQAVREQGIDPVYLALERLFYEEPIVFVDSDGKAVFTPYDALEIWDYLENLYTKLEEV